jgi:hypothetical protein
MIFDETQAHAQSVEPLDGHFHPQGKAPSKYTGQEDARSADCQRDRQKARQPGDPQAAGLAHGRLRPGFEIMPSTKAGGVKVPHAAAFQAEDVMHADPYEAVPRQAIAE